MKRIMVLSVLALCLLSSVVDARVVLKEPQEAHLYSQSPTPTVTGNEENYASVPPPPTQAPKVFNPRFMRNGRIIHTCPTQEEPYLYERDTYDTDSYDYDTDTYNFNTNYYPSVTFNEGAYTLHAYTYYDGEIYYFSYYTYFTDTYTLVTEGETLLLSQYWDTDYYYNTDYYTATIRTHYNTGPYTHHVATYYDSNTYEFWYYTYFTDIYTLTVSKLGTLYITQRGTSLGFTRTNFFTPSASYVETSYNIGSYTDHTVTFYDSSTYTFSYYTYFTDIYTIPVLSHGSIYVTQSGTSLGFTRTSLFTFTISSTNGGGDADNFVENDASRSNPGVSFLGLLLLAFV